MDKMNGLKGLAFFAALAAAFCAVAGGELDDAHLIGTTDKERAIDYEAGETMTFTLALKNAKPFPAGSYFINWTRTGDDGKTESGKAELSAEKPLVVQTSIDRPGRAHRRLRRRPARDERRARASLAGREGV